MVGKAGIEIKKTQARVVSAFLINDFVRIPIRTTTCLQLVSLILKRSLISTF